jgi:tRNA(Met) C34 N-acetyltransferase TmcA
LTEFGLSLFPRHRKKREAKIKRDVKRGIREPNEQDPFELFVAVTDIRYTYYKDSAKILGQTFGMLVLQDYEAITPNLLARTIETVEGGGIVVLLLKTMSSLKQLYSLAMVSSSQYGLAGQLTGRMSIPDIVPMPTSSFSHVSTNASSCLSDHAPTA